MDQHNQNYKINKLFPPSNKSNLMTDFIGSFSITLPNDALHISQIISNQFNNNNIIISDCTAGVGGNTFSFCKHFKFVNSIEINNERFKLLKNNVSSYDITNINLINDNFMNFIFNTYQDVIYIDPPWGGIGYKKKLNIRLDISNIPIENICSRIINKNITKLIVLKLPLNYDINYIFQTFNNITIYKLTKMFIILIHL